MPRRRARQAKAESDPERKAELERIAEVCAWVPAHAPRDFWEALQYYWFVHLGVTTELNTWDCLLPRPSRPATWRPSTTRVWRTAR